MKRKRALVLGPLPPLIGGDTVSTLNLLRSAYWDEFGIETDNVNTSPGDRIRLPSERLSPRDIFRAFRILLQFLWKMPRAGVVLLWANSRFICTAGLAIILASTLGRRPVVVKVFGGFLARRVRELGRPWRALTVFTLKRACLVLPQTKSLADGLVKEVGLSPSRVVCFPNFLPDGEFQNGLEKKDFSGSCVFVGQVKREKGVFDIIEAVRGRTDLSCDFYGQIAERDRSLFLEEISSNDNLSYRGVLEPGEVREIIKMYDALLLPTYHIGEGYPAVILQAFSAGVPVVTSDWKSIPEIAPDGVRGMIVPVMSPGKILEALERLASDKGLYDSLAGNAFEYVKSFSEREVVRDVLLKRIAELLHGNG